MHIYAVRVSQVVERLRPSIEKALLSTTELKESRVIGFSDWLTRTAVQVSRDSGLRLERALQEEYARCEVHGIKPALTILSFLTSQLHFEREVPSRALEWNARAANDLSGLPPLATAAVYSQRVAIAVQQDAFADALRAQETVNLLCSSGAGLSKKDWSLVTPPLEQVRIGIAYESGGRDDAVIRTATVPEFYKHFLRGRFLLQSARVNAALTEFAASRGLLAESVREFPNFDAVIRLHEARAWSQQNSLPRALGTFLELSERFAAIPLNKAYLAAQIGIANIRRIYGDYREARETLEAVCEMAHTLGLPKTAFHAFLILAALWTDRGGRGNVARARACLTKAENFLNFDINRKEQCNLYRRRGIVEFGADAPKAGSTAFEMARRLLERASVEEAALLSADTVTYEVWHYIRRGSYGEADRRLQEEITRLRKESIDNPRSRYVGEGSAKYLLSKLWRLRAYVALKNESPVFALYCSERAKEILDEQCDPDGRSLSRILLVESLAYSRFGDVESALAQFNEVQNHGKRAGIKEPIRQYLFELGVADESEYVSEMALEVVDWLQDSGESKGIEPVVRQLKGVIMASGVGSLARASRAAVGVDSVDFECSDAEWDAFVRRYSTRVREEASWDGDFASDEEFGGFLQKIESGVAGEGQWGTGERERGRLGELEIGRLWDAVAEYLEESQRAEE